MLSIVSPVQRLMFLVAAALALSNPAGAGDDASGLAAAKALDGEIRKLGELTDDRRAGAIAVFADRIRRQPPQYAAALALNLVIDGAPGSGLESLQLLADTLAEALVRGPRDLQKGGYRTLAELARFSGVRVAVSHPLYEAAMHESDAEARQRQEADFTLGDLKGKKWTLKALRGKVVLVNFWATWCPPCRQELPVFETVYRRFRKSGLVILAITDEDPGTVAKFVAGSRITFPVLLDRSKEAKRAFLVQGVPETFVFDRTGKMAGQTFARPNIESLLEILGRAGLPTPPSP